MYGLAKSFFIYVFKCHAISCARITGAHVERDEATASTTLPLMLAGKHGACTRGRATPNSSARLPRHLSTKAERIAAGLGATFSSDTAIPPARFCAKLVFQLAQPVYSVGIMAYTGALITREVPEGISAREGIQQNTCPGAEFTVSRQFPFDISMVFANDIPNIMTG